MSDAPIIDRLDPARAVALEAALGRPLGIEAGRALPPFFHHLYFWQPAPPAALGPDGHPATGGQQAGGGLIPDLGLPRRMWASGRLVWHGALLAGVQAKKVTRLEGVERKEGRSGPLAFVTLRHDIRRRGALVLSEWQDLVYRAPFSSGPTPGSAPSPATTPKAQTAAECEEAFATNPTLLFRYSALTMNGHRIHYDADYARGTEGYAGLVVHGPLLAQMLILKATDELGPLARFRYRATGPAICGAPLRLCRRERDLWVAGEAGALHMRAEAQPA